MNRCLEILRSGADLPIVVPSSNKRSPQSYLRIRGLATSRREGSPGKDCNDRQFRKCDASSAPARCLVPCATQLRRCFRAHNYQRACGRASWTSDRSLVDMGHSTPARTAVCDDQDLVLVTLASARCSLAVGAHDPQRAFTGCGCCARRSGRTLCALRPWRTLCALRPWRSRWAGGPGGPVSPFTPGDPAAPGSPFGPCPQPATQMESAIATTIVFTCMRTP